MPDQEIQPISGEMTRREFLKLLGSTIFVLITGLVESGCSQIDTGSSFSSELPDPKEAASMSELLDILSKLVSVQLTSINAAGAEFESSDLPSKLSLRETDQLISRTALTLAKITLQYLSPENDPQTDQENKQVNLMAQDLLKQRFALQDTEINQRTVEQLLTALLADQLTQLYLVRILSATPQRRDSGREFRDQAYDLYASYIRSVYSANPSEVELAKRIQDPVLVNYDVLNFAQRIDLSNSIYTLYQESQLHQLLENPELEHWSNEQFHSQLEVLFSHNLSAEFDQESAQAVAQEMTQLVTDVQAQLQAAGSNLSRRDLLKGILRNDTLWAREAAEAVPENADPAHYRLGVVSSDTDSVSVYLLTKPRRQLKHEFKDRLEQRISSRLYTNLYPGDMVPVTDKITVRINGEPTEFITWQTGDNLTVAVKAADLELVNLESHAEFYGREHLGMSCYAWLSAFPDIAGAIRQYPALHYEAYYLMQYIEPLELFANYVSWDRFLNSRFFEIVWPRIKEQVDELREKIIERR